MISIFPLWTFLLYVASFQQHLHNAYISLKCYDIPELVAPIGISLLEDAANTKLLKSTFFLVKVMSSLQKWYGHHHDLVDRYRMCLCHNDHRYVPLIVSTARSFTHSRLIIGFVTIFTRRVPLMHHDLQTLQEHLTSPRSLVGLLLLDL
jgi:hypothetical protein